MRQRHHTRGGSDTNPRTSWRRTRTEFVCGHPEERVMARSVAPRGIGSSPLRHVFPLKILWEPRSHNKTRKVSRDFGVDTSSCLYLRSVWVRRNRTRVTCPSQEDGADFPVGGCLPCTGDKVLSGLVLSPETGPVSSTTTLPCRFHRVW